MFMCNVVVTGQNNKNVTEGLPWYEKAMTLTSQHRVRGEVDDPVSRKPVKEWTNEDVDILLHARCQTNPPTFRHGILVARECKNKQKYR